jgi:hypothetical protein
MTTYSLEDIIQAEVAKALSRRVVDEPEMPVFGGNFDLQGITKLLSEINKLVALWQQKQQIQQQQIAAPAPPSAPTPQKPSSEERYNQLIEGLEAVIGTVGDLQLSELLDYAKENKQEVVGLLEKYL